MSAQAPERLEAGPTRSRGWRGLRRVVRGLGVGLATAVVLLGVSLVTASGWQPPEPRPPLDVEPLPVVAPWDRHLPYAFVDRVDLVTESGRAARLVRPRGARGTIPGAVLVAGAGRTTRDDLAEEAEALARGGVAVLTYDKTDEGYGALRRDYAGLAADALLALRTLARQPGVDPGRLGLVGWSEGGWVAPLAAAQDPGLVAFTVLVSAPMVSPLEQASWVVDRRLRVVPGPLRAGAAALLVTGRSFAPGLDTDVRPELAATERRTYAVWGAEDTSVPVRTAVGRFVEATRGRAVVEVVPGAGHRVPVATGWVERVSDWVRRGYPTDDRVRGVQPADLAGLPTLPRPGWPPPPVGLAAAVLVGIGAGAWRGPGSVRSARSG